MKMPVLLRQGGGHLPDFLHRCRIFAMGQHANTCAQASETGTDPFLFACHGGEQFARTFTFVFFLYGATVEQGLAQDPAVIGSDEVFLDQQLVVAVDKVR